MKEIVAHLCRSSAVYEEAELTDCLCVGYGGCFSESNNLPLVHQLAGSATSELNKHG